ncbi:hypothetical protein OBP_254 [Pseudomonas phage OBP]|uniref:hypothetical protein n=1 Tax=Pseudomonas phage OBP TaxID=1124849 RepID=UPI000240D5E7|nr:hypothetical protein OBP_254 [Pseudomonas phage OBP]AEV89691.1 hypothetical protein OBP_254 [Pseudomonas phage OBP]
MFNLINTGSSKADYINAVIAEVERIAALSKEEASKVGKTATIKLVHEVQFVKTGIRSNAHIRANTTFTRENGKIDCQSETFDLEDGINYSHDVFNEIIEDCTAAVINWIDMAIICGNDLSPDDINHEFQQRLIVGLRSGGVFEKVTSSVVASQGVIQSVTITVV